MRQNRIAEAGALHLQLAADGTHKVSGTAARPVIDTTGKVVTERFNGDTVAVTFKPALITITNK